MQRRGFLKRLFGVAATAVVSDKLIPHDGVSLTSMAHPKIEGASIPYDPTFTTVPGSTVDLGEVRGAGGVMKRAEFADQLAKSLNEAFEEAYEGWPDDDERLG